MAKELLEKRITEELESIAREVGLAPVRLSPELDLYHDLEADSLAAVEMVMLCEERFDMTFEDSAALEIRTVGDLIKYIKDRSQKP